MHATGSQYVARQVDEDDVYTHQVFEPNGHDYLGPNMTPAQAEIFAFGLNMISQGYTLVGRNPLGNYEEHYDGPTEGVRA